MRWPPLLVYAQADLSLLDRYRPDLPAGVKARLAGMTSPDARARSLSGYWLLEQACLARGLECPDLASLVFDDQGRPSLRDGPEFNISHSRELAACVIADSRPVGLDVELEREIQLDRFKRFLTAAEWQACQADPRAFFTAWTTREAVVKATGRVGLSRIAKVIPEQRTAELEGERLHLQHHAAPGGYRICVASYEALPPVEIQRLGGAETPRK